MDCPEHVAYSIYFLVISPSNESCHHQLETFLMLCSFLGIPMAPEKTVGPSTTVAFAGIELDTVLMEARLPQEKLDKCRDLLSIFLRRRKVTLQEIHSLTGLLNFACTIVVPGWAFLRRLIDLTIGVRKPHFLIPLSKDVKEDKISWFGNLFSQVLMGAHFFWLISGKILIS